jgi:ankyrin repeat protein
MTRNHLMGFTSLVLALTLLTGAAAPPDPLIDAVKAGDVAAVRTLLRGGANASVAQGDGLTPLHLAAQSGNLEIVRLLLGSRANVEAKTKIGDYTPLHLAAGAGNAAVVEALLGAGADVAAVTTSTGVTPLHLAAKAINGEAAVRALLAKGAPVNVIETAAGQTPLMFAAAAGRTASVRALLEGGADPLVQTEVIDLLEQTAIDREAQNRLRNALRAARGLGPAAPAAEPQGNGGFGGQFGGGGRQADQDNDQPLTAGQEQQAIAQQRAFLSSEEERAKLIEGFDRNSLNGTGRYYDGGPQFTSMPITQTLVGKTGGMSALHHAARAGHVDAVAALLDGGADIDQTSGDGSTPLVLALLNGQYDLAVTLIERGANPNIATSTDNVSPLFATLQTRWALKFTGNPQPRAQAAAENEHMAVLKALLDAGADPNVRISKHLWHFEWEGKIGLDITGATPFWRAAFAQDVEAMKLLASYGADPHIPTAFGPIGLRTRRQPDGRQQEDSGLPLLVEGLPNMYPIHAAAGGGYLGLGAFQQNNVPNAFLASVQFLVDEHGADVNIKDAWGYTPLHYAAVRGGDDLIQYLVDKGADVTAPSRLGQSPVDMARGGQGGFFLRTPYPKTVELLQSLGSPFLCLKTHFRDTGDWCPGAGVEPFEGALVEEDAAAANRPTF